jgi:hypothetical protein
MNDQKLGINLDNQFIFSQHVILVDSTLKSLQTPEGIKMYAKKAIRRVLDDDATISSVKLKKPHMTAKIAARFAKRPTQAKLYITTEF